VSSLANLVFPRPEGIDRRVALTLSCRDTDRLPKVEGAGSVVDRDGHAVQIMHNGVLVHEGGYLGGWTTEIIEGLDGHHEPQEEVAFAEVLRLIRDAGEPDAPLIVELGSFWAYYSLWFLQEFPSGKAVCLEPDPRYLEVGRLNFALNDRQAEFVHGVIGDGSEQSITFEPESDLYALDQKYGPIDVRQYSLDQLAQLGDSATIDVLLVDIQGAEVPLLEASLDRLRDGLVRYAVISTHHRSISGSFLTHQRTIELVEAAGGVVLAEHSVSESFSGDGLVVASFTASDPHPPIPMSYARAKDSLFGEVELEAENLMKEHAAAATAFRNCSDALDEAQVRLELVSTQLENARFHQQEAEREAKKAGNAAARARKEVAAMKASRSWRVTKPMRKVLKRS